MRPLRRQPLQIALTMFFLFATGAFGDVTYQYTGKNFTNVSSSFTTSDHISITMTLSAPLGGTQSNLDVTANIVSISISNGVDTITQPGNADYISAVVSTTSNGDIFAWSVKGQNVANNFELIWTTNIYPDFIDEVNFGAETAAWIPNSGGTWVLTTPPTVPSISLLNPSFTVAGRPSFMLSVSGNSFITGATIRWNGSPLITSYVNNLGLNAMVPAEWIASAGSVNITVVDPGGGVSNSLTFTIRAPVTINTPPLLPSATIGSFYSQALSASGGVAPYSWAVVGGILPPGLSLSNSSGTITGTPTAAGTLSFTVAASDFMFASNASRTFNLTVAKGLTVTTNATLPSGGVGTFYSRALTASGGVAPYVWSLASGALPAGLSLSSSGIVSGTPTAEGTSSFTAMVTDAASLSGTQAFSLTIGVPTGPSFIGSMAHLAAQENWTTTFTLVNKGTATVQTQLSFFGDLADPGGNGPLTLPLTFPQQGTPTPVLNSVLNQNISANASLIVTTPLSPDLPLLVGSAQLAATGAVDGFAIFHQIATTQEAVVPMETRNASSYLLAFDNTNGLVLGVAVQNISAQSATIPVIIRDDSGNVISSPGTSMSLEGTGHAAFVLSDPVLGFPVTADKRGTIEFDTPVGGRISVLGIRFSPPNNALTTIPALANVGIGGGSIAHLASGGDGWQTTFVLVNVGTNAAQATLNFFADGTGAPLPLSFPQGGATTTDSSVTQMLSAGATLLVQSSGAPQLLTGSAVLSTTGNVSGFVIFRHNGQEAVVPLESRNANGYVIAFDNTNGTATGIAVNAVSAQAVNIPVVVRDDSGVQIATDNIAIAANGHYAFTLGTERYPAALAIRGTIEFDAPAGATIGALGIRIPAGATTTYTTLPALAK